MRKKNIRCVLRHGLILVTILLCLFAVCATPAAAADVYEEASNYDMLSTHIRIANENPSNSYTIVITDSFAMGYPDTDEHGALTITGNVTLTTNSTHPHTLSLIYPVSMFTIENGGKLTICGNNSKELTLQGFGTNTNSLINVSGGTFTMKTDSTLTGNNIAQDGGAVIVNSGKFVMEDGTITGNTAGSEGGGVCVENGGTFEMKGGKITKNTATNHGGGGVKISKDGTFTMSGGEISENHGGFGSGVFVLGGTFEMSSGKITKNTGWSTGVYLAKGGGEIGTIKVCGSAEIIDNEGENLYIADNNQGQMFVTGTFTGRIEVTHGNQKYKEEAIRFATGDNYQITAEDAKHFFADDSLNYAIHLREDGLYLVTTHVKAIDPPKQTSVWIAAPVDSKLGSGILDDPNGGKVNFPEGFPFKSVTINQAGEVTQSSPSSAETDFPESDTRQILASADLTASPALPSDGTVTIEFTVPIEKIPDGYTVGVYHGVVKGQEESAAQDAYDAGSKAWEASNEVHYILQECNSGLNDPSFNLEAAYYALQEAIQKTKEAIKAAKDAATRADFAGDKEAEQAALDAAEGAAEVLHFGEDMMAMIVEKLGYVPGEPLSTQSSGYAWKAEKVIETGRSDGLVHYAVEVNGLSPFIIVVEQGEAEPVKEYDADVVPPLDLEPSRPIDDVESPAPLLGVLAGLGAVVCLRRR